MPLNLVLTTEQKIQVTINPATAAGNPAELDGIPAWNVLEGDCTLQVAEDGKSAYILSGNVGSTVVEIAADADLDDDEVRTITDLIAVNVVAAEAAGLGLGAGEPELK
jgi:hypothetical protein